MSRRRRAEARRRRRARGRLPRLRPPRRPRAWRSGCAGLRRSRRGGGAGCSATPSASRRLSQARSSGVALKLLGKTRPLEPTKVSSPSAALQARRRVGRESLDRRAQPLRRRAVSRQETLERLAVREIEAAAPGEQEFSRRRGRGVVDDDAMAARRENFGGHEAGGAGAHDDRARAFVTSIDPSSPMGFR